MKQDLYDMVVDYVIENQDKFYRLAYSYVKNQEDASDIVQDAIFNALENCQALRRPEAVKTWFYRILVNECLLFIRKRKREIPAAEESVFETPYYEKGYEQEESLYKQINMLEADVQEIVKLRFLEELSLKEIGEVMNMNLNTVKAKLYRGLKKLKQVVLEEEL